MVGSIGIGYWLDFNVKGRRTRGLFGIAVFALLDSEPEVVFSERRETPPFDFSDREEKPHQKRKAFLAGEKRDPTRRKKRPHQSLESTDKSPKSRTSSNLTLSPDFGLNFGHTSCYASSLVMEDEELRNIMGYSRGQLPQSLKKLHIKKCKKLQCLLDDNVDTSTSLRCADEDTSTSHHLQDLNISFCPSLTCLPSIHQLTSLTITSCPKLTTLSSMGQLYVSLKHLQIDSCSELTALLPKGQLPETLETLYILSCPKLESIVEKFHNNKALYNIEILYCRHLKSFPEGLETLIGLHSIMIIGCGGFPKGRFPNSNLSVIVSECEKLEALPSGIHNLSFLAIHRSPNIRLSEEGLPTKLASLSISDRKQYKALMELGLHNLTSLSYLRISGQLDGESLQEEDMRITLPHSLTDLSIEDFPNLKFLSFKDFEHLPSLEELEISNCPELTSLPSLPPPLLQLHIRECPLLKDACKRDKGKEWSKIADIPFVTIDHKFIYELEETSEN
ncbi:hypothetical protein EZV62_009014 [Acer yangbiense]|uniref:NB-ARC domain-containing protein n=1 Tax=Acer yangbiense TaxID=1000413 RepID=A0A5C7IFG9_9ROSI|nr:hypothetical protein EZV62_009014 [Acer yangbiense]